MPLLPLGGPVKVGSKVYTLDSTCNIDCTMQILYYLNEYTEIGRQYFLSKSDKFASVLQDIFTMMKNLNLSSARVCWIQQVLGLKIQGSMSMFGAERDQGVAGIKKWLKCLTKKTICREMYCPSASEAPKMLNTIDEFPVNSEMFLSWFKEGKEMSCHICHSAGAIVRYSFVGEPPRVFAYVCNGQWPSQGKTVIKARESDLKRKQIIGGTEYTVQAYTMFTGNHFYAVFLTSEGRFTYDNSKSPLQINSRHTLSETDSVNSVWLLKD